MINQERTGLPEQKRRRIAVLGGTGKEGSGLAFRWANAGYSVIIGSRQAEKAQQAARELNDMLGGNLVRGMANDDAAREAEIVVLTVPYEAHRATLESVRPHLQGKLLVAGDDEAAKQIAIELADAADMRGVDAGPLVNAIVAESLTPVLRAINKRYGVKGAGIRITEI